MPQLCNKEQRLRDGLCCNPSTCEDEGFKPCTENYGNDECYPCPPGTFISGKYHTNAFTYSPCVQKQNCLPEEILDENDTCVCDRAEQYIGKQGNCILVYQTCPVAGKELDNNGDCTKCKEGYFKETSTNAVCRRKSTLKCTDNQMINEGNATTDRSCVPKETITYSTTLISTRSTIQPSDNDGQTIGLIVGLTLGGFVLILLLLFVIYLIRRKSVTFSGSCNSKGKKQETTSHRTPQQTNPRQGIEHEENFPSNLTEDGNQEPGKLIEEYPLSHMSGGCNTDKILKAVPFEDIPLIDNNEERDGARIAMEMVQDPEEASGLLSRAEGGVDVKSTTPKEIFLIQEDENRHSNSPMDTYPSSRVRPVGNTIAMIHSQENQRDFENTSIEQTENRPLLRENPELDDPGRLVNGPNSMSMPYRDLDGQPLQNGFLVNGAPPDLNGNASGVEPVSAPPVESGSFTAIHQSI